jgi:predicted hydrocarbon binding protein
LKESSDESAETPKVPTVERRIWHVEKGVEMLEQLLGALKEDLVGLKARVGALESKYDRRFPERIQRNCPKCQRIVNVGQPVCGVCGAVQ